MAALLDDVRSTDPIVPEPALTKLGPSLPVPVPPSLDPAVGERIRGLLRDGDWESAASYAEMVMASVGINPEPKGGR